MGILPMDPRLFEMFELKATVAQREHELDLLRAELASYKYSEAQMTKLLRRLRTHCTEPTAISPIAMVVAGRPISPADVPDEHGPPPTLTWLQVPFDEKDTAKGLGAKWDPEEKKWYVPPHLNLAPFHRWNIGKRIDLTCPFEDKDAAKQLGAKWNPYTKTWYVTANMELGLFAKWLPTPSRTREPSTQATSRQRIS